MPKNADYKARIRELMASADLPYAEAKTRIDAADGRAPASAKNAAAVKTLLSGWSGTSWYDEEDGYDSCGGATDGDDEDGPICGFGDEHRCSNCHLAQIQRMATCQGEAGCGLPTRLRVSAVSIRPKLLLPSDGDPGERDPNGYVTVGHQLQRMWSRSACGSACARKIMERYGPIGDGIQFEVDTYRYEPDPLELSPALRSALINAHRAVRDLERLAADLHTGGPLANPSTWWSQARSTRATCAGAMADVPDPTDVGKFAPWEIRITVQQEEGQMVYTVTGRHMSVGGWLTPDMAAVLLDIENCQNADDLAAAVAIAFPGATVTVHTDPLPNWSDRRTDGPALAVLRRPVDA